MLYGMLRVNGNNFIYGIQNEGELRPPHFVPVQYICNYGIFLLSVRPTR